jgi:hypothetical protein
MFLLILGNVIYSDTAYPLTTKGPSLCKSTAGHTVVLNFFPFFPEQRNTSLLNQSEMNTLAKLCRIYIQITHALLTCITVHIKTNQIEHFPFDVWR